MLHALLISLPLVVLYGALWSASASPLTYIAATVAAYFYYLLADIEHRHSRRREEMFAALIRHVEAQTETLDKIRSATRGTEFQLERMHKRADPLIGTDGLRLYD